MDRAAIALVGTTARRSLRETPEFADAKRQLKKTLEVANQDLSIIKNNPVISAKLLNGSVQISVEILK